MLKRFVALCALVGCTPTAAQPATSQGPPAPATLARGSAAPLAELPSCKPPKRGRVFVTVQPTLDLADFEDAAFAADHILATLRSDLCAFAAARDEPDELVTALAAGGHLIQSIVFESARFDAAAVTLEAAGAEASGKVPGAAPSFRLELSRAEQSPTWHLVSATAVRAQSASATPP